ncbi:amino acid ABC transporter substrate-binding protein [Roseomonas alkaliterrae]|uniref:General L-amino acid transport system substrate-binding protein n=1 Tax=Neoroseomonas alkaliterrae TaxID=1452450 RepID=A0A840XPL5_9PROT|nr:amino acid ABC transporter substrate-binding protein [Neoroseomonas alkaliterrae]MBB5688770.1 general L-amino acid transport system substrate-binding protein [Neoroseomonas alkaliterrae]MBR0675122.1 amino acid ABC transporter substrate-binding protein [Neoroseomonas alkaliterrae]
MTTIGTRLAGLAVAGALAWAGQAQAQQAPADTVAAIRARGQLICGVSVNAPGFALPDSRGEFRGLDVDTCRAVAAAILGDATRVRFVPNTAVQRFPMLQSGEVDMLARNTTWTLARESQLGLAFAGINFYDGQGFMVRRSSGVTSARQLDGATVCVQPGTTTELNLADYFRTNRMRFTPVVIESVEEIRAAFVAGRCDAYTNDISSLASFRATRTNDAAEFVLLPEVISKEPLGPVVRKGDWRFFDIVRWSLFAQIAAEELGVTSANVEEMARTSTNPDVQRLLGRTAELGRSMGVDNDWALRIIRQVGNYGEMYERNITPIGIPRGVNNLWTNGGLHYAPPIR